jgi:AcrR family transcriptional regulator
MTRRERKRVQTLEEIKQIARMQMAERGTASISLNAIARQMEMSTPALYRYYKNRDDLVTNLIEDAFNDLADTLESVANRDSSHHGEVLLQVILAYRQWAIDHPIDFELIYGNPIPGYHAPAEITEPAARRGFAAILRILASAYQEGLLKPLPEHKFIPEKLNIRIPSEVDSMALPIPEVVYYIGLVGWYRIHGMVMLELFHHIQSSVENPALFFEYEMRFLLNSIGLLDEIRSPVKP